MDRMSYPCHHRTLWNLVPRYLALLFFSRTSTDPDKQPQRASKLTSPARHLCPNTAVTLEYTLSRDNMPGILPINDLPRLVSAAFSRALGQKELTFYSTEVAVLTLGGVPVSVVPLLDDIHDIHGWHTCSRVILAGTNFCRVPTALRSWSLTQA